MRLFVLAIALVLICSPAGGEPKRADESGQVMRVLDEFMVAFNARDERAFVGTMHFPHVRVASDRIQVDESAESMMASFDFDQFAERFEWHHSAWLSRKIVQSGPDKVHVATRFARYRADGSVSAEFDSLYIVSRRDGRWGIVGRSSFAP
jgi:hypothetical protein